MSSTIAPHSNTVHAWDVRFVFTDPVYAFGGTFYASEAVPNPFNNNIKNKSTTVTAYDIVGNPVELAVSSSYVLRLTLTGSNFLS